MCFILVHVGIRSVLVLLKKAYMGEDEVQLNSYVFFTFPPFFYLAKHLNLGHLIQYQG